MPVAKLRPKTYRELVETFSVSVPDKYNFAFDFLDASLDKALPVLGSIVFGVFT